ncbi:MAG: septation ring formation regulator EzrA [Acidovorax sp.]|nr:MAG: septation ring formation regulator EzrA [Acidovorax sp.]
MGTRIVPLALLLLLVGIHAQLWTGRGSVGHVEDMRRQIAAQQAANAQARQANERLAAEVQDLRMVKPGEIYVHVTPARK